MVKGGDSKSEGCEFESLCHKLDRTKLSKLYCYGGRGGGGGGGGGSQVRISLKSTIFCI